MKLQHMAVIFIIIFLPIILVTSYYISLQVDTIKLQESYDTKLLDATYDAMSAFELNTANEDLSTEADSLRSIIEASNNIFFNTLATNMGVSNASKSYVQPYIPAILYTLYDGYYIYSPTSTPEVCTDEKGQTISTDSKGVTFLRKENGIGFYNFNQGAIEYENGTATAVYAPDYNENNASVKYSTLSTNGLQEEYGQLLYKNIDGTYSTVLHSNSTDVSKSTYYKQSYILKSFVSYTATYEHTASGSNDKNVNVTVNYTLDNFLTIEGSINNIYYTKSGYLISSNLIPDSNITVDGVAVNSWTQYSQETLDSYINDPGNHNVTVTINNYNNNNVFVSTTTISNTDGSTSSGYWDDAQSAVQYYVDAWLFSSWVRENLSNVKASEIINNDYGIYNVNVNNSSNSTTDINSETTLKDTMFHKFSEDDEVYPFSADASNDPEDSESSFSLHRRNVIKNSITYNLTLSMIVYTEKSKTTEFSMPILQEYEWDKILNNVSIVTFMQGLQCGLKIYNNYVVVSSTNNEITVTPNEIYYVPRELGGNSFASIEFTKQELTDGTAQIQTAHRIDCLELNDCGTYISFKSKEIKYDKVYNKTSNNYIYDHMVYTDYSCIVDSNYTVGTDSSGNSIDGNTDILNYLINGTGTENKLKAYRIAVAKERNNLYKSIAFLENSGYQSLTGTKEITNSDSIPLSSFSSNSYDNTFDISHISGIDIVIEDTQSIPGVYTLPINVSLNDGSSYSQQILPINSTQRRTVSFSADFNSESSLSSINISFATTTTIKAIKIYYK